MPRGAIGSLAPSSVLSLAFALALGGLACGQAEAQQTVDQMTCAQAQAYAARNGKFYKSTPMGVLPIFPAFPSNGPERCEMGEQRSYHMERTRDTPRCPVGYKCEAVYEFWGR